MNTRWAPFLLAALLAGVSPAFAEPPLVLSGPRPSHRPITGDLEGLLEDDALNERLKGLKPEGNNSGQVSEEMRKLAEDLLKNPKLLEALKGQLTEKDIKRLREQLGKGKGLEDPEWKRLMEGLKGKDVDREKVAKLEELWKKHGGGGEEPGNGQGPDAKAAHPGGIRPPTPEPPPPDTWDAWKGKLSDWVGKNQDKWIRSLDEVIDSPFGQSWRDALRKANLQRKGAGDSALARRARGLAGRLPRLGGYLPKRLPGALRDARLPSLRYRAPGLPSGSGGSSARQAGSALLWVILLVVLAFVLWRTKAWYQRHLAEERSRWRLGPWPVRPGAVSTREELVRAFEHLALLCLGRPARSRHHLDLARQLAEQPDLDPDRRRSAAAHLAHLYEQARYAPGDEPLPEEELASARRELCYLAGVSCP
jgi:hypothetical protein